MATTHPLFDHENFHFDVPKQIIISYAIRNHKGKVSPKQVRNCRLVNSDWLRITTQVLRQAREPLFYLKLDHEHGFNDSGYCDKKSKTLLDLDQASPFALKGTIKETFFRSENSIKTIGQNLSRFQDNLVSLKVAINPKTSNLLFPGDLKLSLLQHLNFEFTKNTSKPASLSLQPILDSCPELKTVGFSSGSGVFDNVVLPKDFTRVTLPETLTAIEFTSKLKNQHLELMTRCSLPKLKKFTLLIYRTPFEEGLIYRVLDNVKGSLEYLFFQGERHDQYPHRLRPTYFRFPVMEKLKKLDMETMHFEFEPGVQSLETYFPNLTKMRLMHQSQATIKSWARSNSKLTSVTKLDITMKDDNFQDYQYSRFYFDNFSHYCVNLNETVAREIAHTFPNVTDFLIDFHHGHFNALKVVWQEMKQLQMLTLIVPKPKGKACQDKLTSVLLGISLEVAASLRTKQLKTVELDNSSVKEMKNLKVLRIVEKYNPEKKKKKNSNMIPYVSNSVFELALLKMPQLKHIKVQEKFWISQKMIKEWESGGIRRNIGE